MKKYVQLLVSVFMLSIVLVGCSQTNDNVEELEEKPKVSKNVSVYMPDGLPAVGMSKLIKENPVIRQGYSVEYYIEKTPETLSTQVMKEEADIAIVPSNMAAIAYNSTSNYQILGTVGEGSFYLVSSEEISTLEDLKGKEVYNTGKGLTPDITVKSLLQKSGVDINEINFSYVNSTSELVPLLLTNKAKTAFVPEPALTTLIQKNPDIKIIDSLNEKWKDVNGLENGYPQSTLIAKKSFIDENQEFIDVFTGQVSSSINWANDNKEDVSQYVQEVGVTVDPNIVGDSMNRANLEFSHIKDVDENYNGYYQSLFEFDPKSVGGKLPDEGIYFKDES